MKSIKECKMSAFSQAFVIRVHYNGEMSATGKVSASYKEKH